MPIDSPTTKPIGSPRTTPDNPTKYPIDSPSPTATTPSDNAKKEEKVKWPWCEEQGRREEEKVATEECFSVGCFSVGVDANACKGSPNTHNKDEGSSRKNSEKGKGKGNSGCIVGARDPQEFG